MTWPDRHAGPLDQARQDQARQDQARQDQARQDQARQDQARQSRESRILGGIRALRSTDAARIAGVSIISGRRFWRALGFPNVNSDVHAFTDRDAEALRQMADLVAAGVITERQALEMTRAIGRSVDRMAAWQIQVMHDVIRDHHAPATPAQEAEELAKLVTSLVNHLEPLVVHAWRRHLVSALADQVADLIPPEGIRSGQRTVGFIDMVGFTQAVHALDRQEVAHLVDRFEVLVSDHLAARDVRMVKTIGDEVMFVTHDADSAIRLSFDVIDTAARAGLPKVRIGIASGEVVDRLGDLYGTTVNRAARLTETGIPSVVVVDQWTAAALTGSGDLTVDDLPAQHLKGIGIIQRHRVDRTPGQ